MVPCPVLPVPPPNGMGGMGGYPPGPRSSYFPAICSIQQLHLATTYILPTYCQHIAYLLPMNFNTLPTYYLYTTSIPPHSSLSTYFP